MIRKIVNFLFTNGDEQKIKNLMQNVENQHNQLKQLKNEYNKLKSWSIEYYNMLNKVTVGMNTSVWRKDIDHKYTIANPTHCKNFFGIDSTPECLEFIKGKTDEQLIQSLYRDKGFKNTYGEICMLSDKHVLETKQINHYLEGGIVDDEQLLLYIIKMPEFDDNGNINGTYGIAWDLTSSSKMIVSMLNRWIYSDKVTQLYHNKDVFCYAIDSKMNECDIFKHICPIPKKDKDRMMYACDQCDQLAV